MANSRILQRNSMHALPPTASCAYCPPKHQRPFSSPKTKAKTANFCSFAELSHYKQTLNHIATPSLVNCRASAPAQALILDEWPRLLKSSIGSGDLLLGEAVHGVLFKLGFQNVPFGGNNLINMYVKFNRVDCAQRVFDDMLDRDTVTWTSLINGYLQINGTDSVFRIAHGMHKSQQQFNEHTCSVILQACESPECGTQGEQIHGFAVKCGFYENVIVGTSLVSMYSRSGLLEDAEKLLSDLPYKDVQCLNLMILEYRRVGLSEKAIGVFIELLNSGLEPNDYTLTNVISACNGDREVGEGRQIHALAIKYDFLSETSVKNAIITMYGKYGLVEEAEGAFYETGEKDLVSWTALLSVYVKNGQSLRALSGFLEMVSLGIYSDASCLATVIDGCSESKKLKFGLQIHGVVIKLGLPSDVNVGTALIDLYAKCGKLQSARLVLDKLHTRNTVSFNAILDGFKVSKEEDVMGLFNEMRLAGIKADSVTFAQLLALSADRACSLGGTGLHALTIKSGFDVDYNICNATIAMYAKCGNVQDAYQVFTCMKNHDLVSWNAMISAYALHGEGKKAVSLFEEMIKEGFIPDEIAVLGVLQACNYSGLWEYGLHIFNEMKAKDWTSPVIEHFACMVDLLGRAGFLSEALDFITKSPFSDSPLLWRTLVHVCKLRGDLSFGRVASKHLLDLAPKEAGSYILVSNMYAGGGMLDEASQVRTTMNDLRLSKEAGCSWIEINNITHQFVASCKDHPESRDIYANLELLGAETKQIYDDGIDLQPTLDLF